MSLNYKGSNILGDLQLQNILIARIYTDLRKSVEVDNDWKETLTTGIILHECRLYTKYIGFKPKLGKTKYEIGNKKADQYIFKYINWHYNDCIKFIIERHKPNSKISDNSSTTD